MEGKTKRVENREREGGRESTSGGKREKEYTGKRDRDSWRGLEGVGGGGERQRERMSEREGRRQARRKAVRERKNERKPIQASCSCFLLPL